MDVPFVEEKPEARAQLLVEGQRSLIPSFPAVLGPRFAVLAENLALTAVYVGCGKLGLMLAFVNASASAVWPPTGVALAALLVRGYRLWPGVFLGAFLVNITTQGSLATNLGIAGGNTCEALIGAWLVRRFAAGLKAFTRTRTFFRFVVLAGLISTIISPVVGVTSLCLGGFAPWNRYGAIWLTWWLGDMISNLVVAPLLLIWFVHGFPQVKLRQSLEAASLLIVLVLLGRVIFLADYGPGIGHFPLTYLALLPLLWAAFRFGERGAVTAAFVTAGIAVWGTLRGWGPFAIRDPNASLLFLQAFVGTAAVMAIALALAISERKLAEQLLSVKCAVCRQLVEASTLDEALTHMLECICATFRCFLWDLAAFWTVDEHARVLRCSHTWHAPWASVKELEAVSRQLVLAPGISLPGQVWADGREAWIPDLQKAEINCPRGRYSRKAELHGACAFPVPGGKDCVGVIELFSREIQPPDPEMRQVFQALGAQIGQFIQRKAMQEQQHRSRERLALVIEGSSDGIWDWDMATNEAYFSPRWKSMLGYADGEVDNHFSAWEQLLHPADREHSLASLRAYLDGQSPTFELEHRLRHRDGSYRWILSRGVALRDAAGKPVRMAGSHVDLTARKQAAEQLERAYAELSQNEAALNSALQRLQAANEQLQTTQLQLIQSARLESVGTLAAGVAHEVKNPLQTILMGLEYLDHNPAVGDDTNTTLVLTDMRDAVNRANAIIRELLQLSAAKGFALKQEDLNALLERSLRLLNSEIIASQIKVVRKLAGDLPRVLLDCGKMEQVFINLFINALQAMSQGGVLTVTTRHRRFGEDLKLIGPAFSHFGPGDPVVIAEVQDTGTGIPETNLPRIFEPFFTTKPTGVGTGLGLSVVKKIMDLHGAAIDIRNAPLGGVLVVLVFKAEPGEKP
jgi:PAS domain S-box-containing protein